MGAVTGATDLVLIEIAHERLAQDAKWGEQNHDDGTGNSDDLAAAAEARAVCQAAFAAGEGTWRHVLDEEIAEAYAEHEPADLRAELLQVAAVAVAWVEAIDRRASTVEQPADKETK